MSREYWSPVVAQRQVEGVTVTLQRQTEARCLPPHGHAAAYFSFLLAGSYRERVGSREYEQLAPSLVYHPSGLEHVDEYGRHGGQILTIRLADEWLERVGSLPARDVIACTPDGEPLAAAAALLIDLVDGTDPDPLAIEDAALRLLGGLRGGCGRAEVVGPGPAWLRRVAERLDAEFDSPPGMVALAREAGVHPAHLSRSFRTRFGCSPTEWVQRRRVRHVWRRLGEDAPPSLAEIALEAGFSDQSHCTRVFRRLVGRPPGRVARRLCPTRR